MIYIQQSTDKTTRSIRFVSETKSYGFRVKYNKSALFIYNASYGDGSKVSA